MLYIHINCEITTTQVQDLNHLVKSIVASVLDKGFFSVTVKDLLGTESDENGVGTWQENQQYKPSNDSSLVAPSCVSTNRIYLYGCI